MPETVGIIAEYNPFHNGHLYQLDRIREKFGPDTVIIAVMSGDYVQRGGPAILNKNARAEMACRSGVNLVLELPLPWCMLSAEGFATAGVFLLNSLHAASIAFGTESEDCNMLEKAAEILALPETTTQIRKVISDAPNVSYAVARVMVLSKLLNCEPSVLERPNNILALEYMRAVKENGYLMDCVPIQRTGAGHDSSEGTGFIRSASQIRSFMSSTEYIPYVPDASKEIISREIVTGRGIVTERLLEPMVLSRLRMLSKEDYLNIPDASGGAGERLHKAVHDSASLNGIYSAASSKTYTVSRIRRMTFSAALGIHADTAREYPPYARVLAADESGRDYLSRNRKGILIPIVTKPADAIHLPGTAPEVFRIGAQARDLYVLSYQNEESRIPGSDYRMGPYMHFSENTPE